ncbi:AAA family ATPase [Nocardia sp. NPDC048505]|uniref:AAA family ATPase n=1 Tax=Nocardia sp. NPDC048505 TaxID=3155756 RepID=UPI0034072958
MNPPLDALPVHSPEPHFPDPRYRTASAHTVAPDAIHDLRGATIGELRYPATSALIFAGVPGAGKSTALRMFFGATAELETPPQGPAGSIVIDSQHTRNRLRHKLGWLPYPLWRPVVHVAHYAGIRAALRDARGPVVIHDCATFGWARRLIARWSAVYGRELHLVMLDVPPTVARAGQYARGRRSNGFFFSLHCRRWQRMMRRLAGEKPRAPVRSASVVLADRTTVNRMHRVTFEAA